MILLTYLITDLNCVPETSTLNPNDTEEWTCIINNVTYTGEQCLEGLGKFGKIVMWIVVGFFIILLSCCCFCWCCICKVIHGKKSSSPGVVLRGPPRNDDVAISTVA